MSVKAKELLEVMKTRLGMQLDGVTNPTDNIKNVTLELAKKLEKIEPNTTILIETENDSLVRYINKDTGDILTTIDIEKAKPNDD